MTIEQRQKQNSEAIKKAISSLDRISYDSVAALIPQMLAAKSLILDPSAYHPEDKEKPHGVGRFLIYDHNESGNQFSIWAFAFAPKQKTSIHDHKYRGTVTVLEGIVSEKFYRPKDQNKAILCARYDRYRFHVTKDDNLENPLLPHQLKYRKALAQPDTVAVTLHIYEMPAHKANSDEHNRNLLSLFSKKASDETKPEYKLLGLKAKL